jgi:hypothetical protein
MTDPHNINYQPLNDMHSAYRKAAIQVMRSPFALFILLLNVITIATVLFSVVPVNVALIFFPAMYIYYVVFMTTSKAHQLKNMAWQNFGVTNGWDVNNVTNTNELVPPSLLQGLNNQFASPILQVQLNSLQFNLFAFECIYSASYRRQSGDYYTVAMVPLEHDMPHILLRSKQLKTQLQRDMVNAQSLKLEGDFNAYFNLQLESGSQIDVLSIVTPDVMSTLIDNNQKQEIEIFGSNLYFMMSKQKQGMEDTKQLIHSVVALSTQLKENIHAASMHSTQ